MKQEKYMKMVGLGLVITLLAMGMSYSIVSSSECKEQAKCDGSGDIECKEQAKCDGSKEIKEYINETTCNDDSCEICKNNVTIDGDNNTCEKCGNTIINIDNGCRIYPKDLCRSSEDCESSCSDNTCETCTDCESSCPDNTCRTTEGQEETKGKIIEKCCEFLEKCCSVFGSLEHLIGVILGLIGLG